jgi:AMMECR1 domain-containing protein
MNYTTYTDTERVTLDAHRTLSRAEEALTAATNLKRFAKLTRGELKDVQLTTATLEATEAALEKLYEARRAIVEARIDIRRSVHSMKIEEAAQ